MNPARRYAPIDKPDILQVIQGEGITIHRRGRDFWAPCPFHGEKSPSFKISPERQSFYCFGCGSHGDVIDFVQRHHGLSYPDALSYLGIKPDRTYQPDPIIERRKKLRAAFETWRRKYYIALADEAIRLHELRLLAERRPPQGEIGWVYAEAIARLPMIDHKLDVLFENDPEDNFQLYCEVNQ